MRGLYVLLRNSMRGQWLWTVQSNQRISNIRSRRHGGRRSGRRVSSHLLWLSLYARLSQSRFGVLPDARQNGASASIAIESSLCITTNPVMLIVSVTFHPPNCFRIASACALVTTAEREAASASFTACRLPKCCSSRRVVAAPTPGISSNSVDRSRICRRFL